MQLIQVFFHNSVCSNQIFFSKIVQINSIGGGTVLLAAYSVYGCISVHFSLENFDILQHCLHQNFAKNSSD